MWGTVPWGNRHATNLTEWFPRIVEAFHALPADDVMLDGEAVVIRPDGHSEFAALRTNRGAAIAHLVAFDVLHLDGEDKRKLPLEIRRAELESLVAGIDGIMFSEAIEAEGAIVFAKACERGSSRSALAAYWSGRVRNWLKVKNPNFQRRRHPRCDR